MKVSREDSFTQVFVLTSHDVDRLCSRLQTLTNKITLEITCKDSLKREFSNSQDLIDFENPANKDIQSLRIMANSEDLNTRVWLKFDKDSTRNIFLSISGDEAATVSINQSIDEILTGLKPWYSLLARTDFYLVLLVIVMLPSLVLLLGLGLGLIKINPNEPFSMAASLPGIVRGSLIGLAPIVFGYVLNRAKRTLFPMGVFAIGQGAKRHKDKEFIRTVVVVAFFISLASSILASSVFAFWR